jgi:hypothetical protein
MASSWLPKLCGFEPFDRLIARWKESVFLPAICFTDEGAEMRRVVRLLWHYGSEAHSVKRQPVEQLSCQATAQVEELRGQGRLIQEKARRTTLNAIGDNPRGIKWGGGIWLVVGSHV